METKKLQFEVIIVGGGPAGTSTALSLLKSNPGLKIALLEKASFDKKRAGEILKPLAQPLLQKIGAWQTFIESGYPSIGASDDTWGSDELTGSGTASQTCGFGWKIDRRTFDALLFNLAGQNGVSTFLHHTFTGHQRNSAEGWTVNVQGPNQEELIFEASCLVDATGQSPSIAPKQGSKKIRFDRLVGISIIFQDQDNTTRDSRLLTEPCSQGWWYSVMLPDNQVLAAFMTDNDIAGDLNIIKSDHWWNLLKQSDNTYDRVKSATPVCDPRVRLADSYCMDPMQGEGWVCVGDATGRLDPLSGHGVSWALQSGVHAAQPIADWLQGDKSALINYQQLMNKEYEKYLIERMYFYSLEKRWDTYPFWQRRQDPDFMDAFQKEIITRAKQNSTPH